MITTNGGIAKRKVVKLKFKNPSTRDQFRLQAAKTASTEAQTAAPTTVPSGFTIIGDGKGRKTVFYPRYYPALSSHANNETNQVDGDDLDETQDAESDAAFEATIASLSKYHKENRELKAKVQSLEAKIEILEKFRASDDESKRVWAAEITSMRQQRDTLQAQAPKDEARIRELEKEWKSIAKRYKATFQRLREERTKAMKIVNAARKMASLGDDASLEDVLASLEEVKAVVVKNDPKAHQDGRRIF